MAWAKTYYNNRGTGRYFYWLDTAIFDISLETPEEAESSWKGRILFQGCVVFETEESYECPEVARVTVMVAVAQLLTKGIGQMSAAGKLPTE